jgi:flagellar hook-basal body complex protein FliE
MTSPLGAIGALAGTPTLAGAPAIAPINTDLIAPEGASAAGADFASKLAEGMQHLQELQSTSNELSVKAASGTLNDAHDYMIASAESGLATSLTVAVRNKAVEAFQEIMRMQG